MTQSCEPCSCGDPDCERKSIPTMAEQLAELDAFTQGLPEEYRRICHDRHEAGAAEYGDSWLSNPDEIHEIDEELADAAVRLWYAVYKGQANVLYAHAARLFLGAAWRQLEEDRRRASG